MLRYGTYIFGGRDSLYVVIDDGQCSDPGVSSQNPGIPAGVPVIAKGGALRVELGF